MNSKICKNCGGEINATSTVCKHCHTQFPYNKQGECDICERIGMDTKIIFNQELCQNHYREKLRSIQVVTTHSIPDWSITKTKGVVAAEIIIDVSKLKPFDGDLDESFNNVETLYENEIGRASSTAIDQLKFLAADVKMNAIVGCTFEYASLPGEKLAVIAYGTIVEVVKTQNTDVSE